MTNEKVILPKPDSLLVFTVPSSTTTPMQTLVNFTKLNAVQILITKNLTTNKQDQLLKLNKNVKKVLPKKMRKIKEKNSISHLRPILPKIETSKNQTTVQKFQSKMDLLGEFYCRSIIMGNQYSNFSNSFIFPTQQTTNNCSKLSSFSSNQSLPINFDSNLINNSIIDVTNNLVNKPTNAFQNQNGNDTILPQSYSTLLSNNNTVLTKKTKNQCLNRSQVSYNIVPFLLQDLQKKQVQCKEVVASQSWIKNILSFVDQTHGVVQKSICKTDTNDLIKDVKLSTISMPLFHATTMQHSTMAKSNDNNAGSSLPFNFSTATTMIQALSTVSSINSVVGNLDRFSPSSISCASIDSGFSELSYQPESPGSSLSVISNPLFTREKENKNTLKKTNFLSTSESTLSETIQKTQKNLSSPKRLFMSIESIINENNSNYFTNNNVKYLDNKNNDKIPPTKKAKILSKVLNQSSVKDSKFNNDVNTNSIITSKIEFNNNITNTFVEPLLISTKQNKNIYSSKASTSTEQLFNIKQECIDNVKTTNNKTITINNIILEKLEEIKPIENVELFLECDCCWTNCNSRFATDNELYDHVILNHIEILHLKQQSNIETTEKNITTLRGRKATPKTLLNKKNDEHLLKCKWDGCEMCLKRGDQQKQYDWLVEHYTTRHAPRAQPFLCLFDNCSLRFRKRCSLNDHLRSAHDSTKPSNGRRNNISGGNNGNNLLSPKSCFGFKPRVQLSRRMDIVDRRTMNWIRTQLDFFKMQKPCLLRSVQKNSLSVNGSANNCISRAQLRKSRQISMQFLFEFDKILELKKENHENVEYAVIEPQISQDNAKHNQKMETNETVKIISELFQKNKQIK